MALTKRQKQVLDFLSSFISRKGYSPSFEEIAEALGLKSLATVHKHMVTLEQKGFIRRRYNQSRSIDIVAIPGKVRAAVARALQPAYELPLLGRIAAGQPLEAVSTPERLSLGDFTRERNVFVLEVKGNSMVDDHILEGDYILVEQTETARAGEIVVALVRDEEATLKRFYPERGGKVRLQPANAEMAPLVVPAKEVRIQGRVIGVLRKY